MKENGFTRSLICKSGASYRLPGNELAYVSSEYRQEVLAKVFSIAEGISAGAVVSITESAGRT